TANHAWGSYHWERSSNPVTLGLGDNVDNTWQEWLQEASTDWSASSVLDTPVVPGKARGNCGARNGRIEICNDTYGNTGWLGVAQIWISGEHITRATAKVNDTYHNTAPYNTDGWRDNVMCQEIGHTFGLDHQDENFYNGNLGTCMDYTSNSDGPPANRQPNPHDYEQLEAIYAHLDAGGDGGDGSNCNPRSPKCNAPSAPPAFNDMELPGPAQWGQLIAISHDGGQAIFEQDFGQGFKVVTHVTWTLEVAAQLASE
ncbi:MAG: hypothetical protein P8Y44_13600, partial [Acidobacteriota bacterium]